MTNIPSIPGWEGVDVAKILEETYKITVFLENDINLAAVGAYYDRYREKADNLALIYLEQGIGSGLILNGELFKGATNFAGELSFLPICQREEKEDKDSRFKGNFEHTLVMLQKALRESGGVKKKELKEQLRQTVVKGLLSFICLINPQIVVLVCSQLSKTDLKAIEEALKEWIGEEHIPRLLKLENIREQSISGLLSLCIREITPTYSLSSRKRG